MAIRQFQQLFEHKRVQSKLTPMSPLAALSRGETLLFATNSDLVLTQSYGYLATSASEMVLVFTSKVLNLVKNERYEDTLLDCLAHINLSVKLGYWVYIQKSSSHQMQYRVILKPSAGFTEEMLWNILGDANNEYLVSGKHLRSMMQYPNTLKETSDTEPAQTQLIRTILEQTGAKRLDASNKYTFSLEISRHRMNLAAPLTVRGEVTVYRKHLTVKMLVGDTLPQYERKILKLINGLNYLERTAGWTGNTKNECWYKANYVYMWDTEDTIRENVKKTLHHCAHQAAYRISVTFPIASARLAISDIQSNISYYGSSTITINLTTLYHSSAIAWFWSKRPSQVVRYDEDAKILTTDRFIGFFNVQERWGLHFFCVTWELIYYLRDLTLFQYEKFHDSFRMDYFEQIFPKIHYIPPDTDRNNFFRSEFFIKSSKLTGESGNLFYNLGGKTPVRKEILASAVTPLWTVCKRLVTCTIHKFLLSAEYCIEIIGFYITSQDFYVVKERLPSLYEFRGSLDTGKKSLELLLKLAGYLCLLHSKQVAYLQLTPFNVKVMSSGTPKLDNITLAPLFLETTLDQMELMEMYYTAPEVFRYMEAKQRWMNGGENMSEKRITSVTSAADVYSFGMVMYWLLLLTASEQCPCISQTPVESKETLLDLIIKQKRRPIITHVYETQEPRLSDLMYQCWGPRQTRPSMKVVHEALSFALSTLR